MCKVKANNGFFITRNFFPIPLHTFSWFWYQAGKKSVKVAKEPLRLKLLLVSFVSNSFSRASSKDIFVGNGRFFV